MEASLTDDKKDEIVNISSEIAKKSFVKVRKLSQVIGKIVAAFLGALYGSLYYRNLEANKISGLKNSKGNCEFYVKVSHFKHTVFSKTYYFTWRNSSNIQRCVRYWMGCLGK